MQDLVIEAAELEAQSATLLPDRETLCFAGCNFQVNVANTTVVQVPISVSLGGDANSVAQAYIDSYQGNEYNY